MVPSRATTPLAQRDDQMGLGRKVRVLGVALHNEVRPMRSTMLPGSHGGTGSCADTVIFNAHQSIAAGASSKIVFEMVQFSFWYLLAQFPLLFTSHFFWNHLNNGNIHLVLFQGEITQMMVERHCLGLAAKC